MKFGDLLRLILGNLNRRKARVALTAVGVVIGTAAVVILVSLAIGLQKNATEQLYGIGELTQIQVMPSYGGETMMVGGGPVTQSSSLPQKPKPLTNSALDEIRAIPGVSLAIPREMMFGGILIRYRKMEGGGSIIGVATDDLAKIGLKAEQGETQIRPGSVVVGALISRNFYDPSQQRPGQEPPPPPELFGQKIQLVAFKYDQNGQESRKTINLQVVGVLAETRGESDYSIYLPFEQVKALNEWTTGQRFNYNKDGYNQVIVSVEDPNQALDVADQITALGFQAISPQSFLQGINGFFMVLQIVFGGVGAIALMVAAIGIANTMTMSILERTREIGLMKAVGATNRDVLTIFLGEAAGIGLLGGLGGVIIGWLVGKVINVLAVSYLAGQMSQGGGILPSMAVYTPLWLVGFALAFSIFVGAVSGLYPALRAATMLPISALKYE